MRAICPNNRKHNEFITTVHVMQDWRVDEKGNHLETVEDFLQITHGADKDNIWSCAICGAEAITSGEIVTLYATVLEGNEDSYADVYNDKEEAYSQIGTYVDNLKVIAVKKGYSLAPKGSEILYDDAPDFCEDHKKIRAIAHELDINLY